MILVLDNYDSFVHNLARYIRQLGCATHIVRSDAITIEQIQALAPEAIVISPGPCTPDEAGICLDVVRTFAPLYLPMLGICLGHQVIAQAFNATIVRALCPTHGMKRLLQHDGTGCFKNLDNPIQVARYHSLIVSPKNFPEALTITSRSREGEIMSLAHKQYPVHGLQFHPESVLTPLGYPLLRNFLHAVNVAATTPTMVAP